MAFTLAIERASSMLSHVYLNMTGPQVVEKVVELAKLHDKGMVRVYRRDDINRKDDVLCYQLGDDTPDVAEKAMETIMFAFNHYDSPQLRVPRANL
jgi:hypothetical protein